MIGFSMTTWLKAARSRIEQPFSSVGWGNCHYWVKQATLAGERLNPSLLFSRRVGRGRTLGTYHLRGIEKPPQGRHCDSRSMCMSCRDALLTTLAVLNLLELRNRDFCIREDGLDFEISTHCFDVAA